MYIQFWYSREFDRESRRSTSKFPSHSRRGVPQSLHRQRFFRYLTQPCNRRSFDFRESNVLANTNWRHRLLMDVHRATETAQMAVWVSDILKQMSDPLWRLTRIDSVLKMEDCCLWTSLILRCLAPTPRFWRPQKAWPSKSSDIGLNKEWTFRHYKPIWRNHLKHRLGNRINIQADLIQSN